MAERRCLLTSYPTNCKDNCFNCDCGGAEATKDAYVSIHNVQRVCAITGGAADTEEGAYIAEVIRNNLENMVISAADIQPANQWISVDKALPIYDGLVLVVDKNNTIRLGMYTELGWTSQFGNPMITYITHWRPLPELPKVGDKA